MILRCHALLLWPFDARRHILTCAAPCLQMSSEDNRNPVDLGNAFDGDSLGPSSPVSEQSLIISWTESSEDNLTSQRHEVATRGEQGNEETSSSGRERWSYVDLISTISLRQASKISTKYGIEVEFLQEIGRPLNPPASHVTVLETFLKFGVQFSLHPYFVRILNHDNLTVFQLSPNGWA